MYCHAFKSIPDGGVNLCTRPLGHRTNHLDTVHNVSWPVPPVHLHGPMSGPACGAPYPADRKRELTAWLMDITCEACVDTLTAKAQADLRWLANALEAEACDCGCVEGNYPCETGSMGEGCGA